MADMPMNTPSKPMTGDVKPTRTVNDCPACGGKPGTCSCMSSTVKPMK